MNAWLVTGGAGFIGANFVRLAARSTDAPLVVFDALTYAGNFANIADLVNDGRVTFVRGDICDETLVGVQGEGAVAGIGFARGRLHHEVTVTT